MNRCLAQAKLMLNLMLNPSKSGREEPIPSTSREGEARPSTTPSATKRKSELMENLGYSEDDDNGNFDPDTAGD